MNNNLKATFLGHVDNSLGWVVDASLAKALAENTNNSFGFTMKGASVSVEINGSFSTGWGFSSPVFESPPSNGIPMGWIFEQRNVAKDRYPKNGLEWIRQRILNGKVTDADHALPFSINLGRSNGAGKRSLGEKSETINLLMIDTAGRNGAGKKSLGQGNSWVADFLVNGVQGADRNRCIPTSPSLP